MWERPLKESVQRGRLAAYEKLTTSTHPQNRFMPSEDTFQGSQALKETKTTHRKQLQDPKIIQMTQHLHQGFDLIRNGHFREAVEHFQHAETLDEMNVLKIQGRDVIKLKIPNNVSEAKRAVLTAAKQNMAYSDKGRLSIKFGNIYCADLSRGDYIIPKTSSEAAVLQHLQHENALMAAEENIHTYQNLCGENITHKPVVGTEMPDDAETDIAATFAAHKVPVTQDFLKRYKSRQAYAKDAEIWDLVEKDGQIQRVQLQAAPSSVSKSKADSSKKDFGTKF